MELVAPALTDFERLRVLIGRSSSVPQIKRVANGLSSAFQHHASKEELELLFLSDPCLAARLLRPPQGQSFKNHDPGYTTIQGALRRLDQRTMRSFMAFIAANGHEQNPEEQTSFDIDRFAKHALFVALFSAHSFKRRLQREKVLATEWSANEVLAAGLLHEFPILLMWRVAPDSYASVFHHAVTSGLSFNDAFFDLYGSSVESLSTLALEAWGLPAIFSQILGRPHESQEEGVKIPRAILKYADMVANMSGFEKCDADTSNGEGAPIAEDVGLSSKETLEILPVVIKQVRLVQSMALGRYEDPQQESKKEFLGNQPAQKDHAA